MTKLSNPNLLDIGVSEEMKGFINYNQTQMKKRIERIYENFLYKKKRPQIWTIWKMWTLSKLSFYFRNVTN